MSNSLRPHGLQHTRLPCPSLSIGICSNSHPLSWWCHPIISSSVTLFSSCTQLITLLEALYTASKVGFHDLLSAKPMPMQWWLTTPIELSSRDTDVFSPRTVMNPFSRTCSHWMSAASELDFCIQHTEREESWERMFYIPKQKNSDSIELEKIHTFIAWFSKTS